MCFSTTLSGYVVFWNIHEGYVINITSLYIIILSLFSLFCCNILWEHKRLYFTIGEYVNGSSTVTKGVPIPLSGNGLSPLFW